MKEIRIFAFVIGGYYTVTSLINILMVLIFGDMSELYKLYGFKQEWMFGSLNAIQQAYAVACPWLIPIGIGFLVFGWRMPHIRSGKLVYLSVLSVFSLIWCLYSCVYISPLFGHIYDDFPFQNSFMQGTGTFIQVIAVISTLAQFTLPQFFMGKEIVKWENNNVVN